MQQPQKTQQQKQRKTTAVWTVTYTLDRMKSKTADWS